MRKLLCLLFLSVLFSGCSTENEETPPAPVIRKAKANTVNDVLQKDSLLVLDIGNSYTEDVTFFLNDVMKANNIDTRNVGLYTAVRGMGSFKTWYNCYYDKDRADYSIRKVLGGIDAITATGVYGLGEGQPFRDLLQKNRWDVIVLHQVSTYAPYYAEWFSAGDGGYLRELLSLVMEHQPQALVGFYVVHSYGSVHVSSSDYTTYARWQQTVDAVNSLQKEGKCDIVIPYGTAIENLRRSSLNNDYDLTRDGTHLELGLARYAAACCYYESLFAPRYGVSMVGQKFHWEGQHLSSPYPVVDVDDYAAAVAQSAAAMAVADWQRCFNPEED